MVDSYKIKKYFMYTKQNHYCKNLYINMLDDQQIIM